jgi:hypothetical protein
MNKSRWSWSWRVGRWIVAASAAPALWACTDHTLEMPQVPPSQTSTNVIPESVDRDIDILFMVDDSQSMAPLIDKLTTNFRVLVGRLEALPGGLPNVHMAVVSSDLGAGRQAGIGHCAVGGDGGEFQDQPRMGCTSSGLLPGRHFISNVNGVANYDTSMDIADVLGCIANLGDQGCGFEHQLQSVVRALGADPAFPLPDKNVGFLRPDAYLAVILLTNEDDCSAPADSALFDSSSQSISDPLGPQQSYRCNERGHLCNGAPPPRTMPASFPPGACVPNDDGTLIPVATIVQQIKSVKRDPSKILVAAIAGPSDPYNVIMVPATAGTADARAGVMWPNVGHSCGQSSSEYADPGVRLKRFVNSFGDDNGLYLSICADSFAPALNKIADRLSQIIEPGCVQGRLADKDGDPTNGVQPDCTVSDRSFDDQGNLVETPVPACADQPGAPRCWKLDPPHAGGRCSGVTDVPVSVLDFVPAPDPSVSSLDAAISCVVCIPGVVTPGCP